MNANRSQHKGSTEVIFEVKGIVGMPYGYTFRVGEDGTNCKLSYIHGIGNLMYAKEDKDKKEVIDFLLTHCKGAVIINTTNKNVAKFINDLYPTYYYSEVPIGYDDGFQYHMCIKNVVKMNGHCRNPIPPKEEKVEVLTKDVIATKLKAVLKTKRRKDDYVEEFIKAL